MNGRPTPRSWGSGTGDRASEPRPWLTPRGPNAFCRFIGQSTAHVTAQSLFSGVPAEYKAVHNLSWGDVNTSFGG